MARLLALTLVFLASFVFNVRAQDSAVTIPEVKAAMKKAALFYHRQVAVHGGYVYHYSLDLNQRWGEGKATDSQIWVQPPGTPTVGMAFLAAHEATGDPFYLEAATDAAIALVHGQLKSGGWTNSIDFTPNSPRTAAYRNGQGKGKNNSSLDDGQTQSALQLVMRVDRALNFKNAKIHESAKVALDALLKAQLPNGGFPQVWTGPVASRLVVRAKYPEEDWRTVRHFKNYWDMYTLNDNVCGYVADALIDAHQIYKDERCLAALRKLGDFLVLAQMPEPQPAWAQQYNEPMEPIWARKFEPPAIAGDESQEVIDTLMKISLATSDRSYLKPIPRALAYLKRSLLLDGQLARFYELKTNKPLYMSRRGKNYSATYDDKNAASHYGWKWESRLTELDTKYKRMMNGSLPTSSVVEPARIHEIVESLDAQCRWTSIYNGERLVGQAKFPKGKKYLSSEVFSRHLVTLSKFLQAAHAAD